LFTSTIRVAFIGAGRIGQTHIKNLAGLPGVEVRVVADTLAENAELGRAIGRADRATTDINAALTAPDVDAVVISTPTSAHASLIDTAARAGKAIWCEKPIALDFTESRRIVTLTEQLGTPIQIGFMRRFDPGYAAAKRKIEAGALGRLETFRAISRDNKLPPNAYLATSGGIYMDMAVHDLDLARFLVGEVAEVSAWGTSLIDKRVLEVGDVDTAVAMLRFENGALGVVETTRRSAWGYDIRTEVGGSIGKVVVDAPQKTPMLFARDVGFEGDSFESFPDRFADAYRDELVAFFAALRAGRRPSPDAADALKTQQLALAATKSWREGRPVKVAEIV
jgi:myo-inositol 2-dehydrogenase/D-chiro-inositol 1-dehydrogenase